jgi:SAM-dependent methyltransferase
MSYFDAAPYNREAEVFHTRTRSWGQAESGVKLSSFKRRMYLAVISLLSRHAASRCSILDVGCSFGGFLEQARIHGFVPMGMDIVPEAVEYTRRQGIPCEVAASVNDLAVPDGSIDVISVLDCNYYWPNQRAELSAVWRKLRPSGLLVMRLVDKSCMLTAGLAIRKLVPALGVRICRRAVNDHRASIPLSSMLHLLRQQGFEIVHVSPRGAMHSDQSSAAVKTSFAIGLVVWHVTGWNVAPGVLVLARKGSCPQRAAA